MSSHQDEPARDTTYRLSALASQIQPADPNSPITRGTGFRMWDTRRANKLKTAIAKVIKLAPAIAELRLAAHEISEHVGALFPESVCELPRGYKLIRNRNGERGVERDGVMFSPSFAEPLPCCEALERLAEDLRTGLLSEINSQFCGELNTSKNKAGGRV